MRNRCRICCLYTGFISSTGIRGVRVFPDELLEFVGSQKSDDDEMANMARRSRGWRRTDIGWKKDEEERERDLNEWMNEGRKKG